MRGTDRQTAAMFSYLSPEAMVPAGHPLRLIRPIVNAALERLSGDFDKLYATGGRDSIAPEKLLRALLLQAFYSVRSERQLMEQITYNMLFRWFVGVSMDAAVWDVTVFTKNRERLVQGDITPAIPIGLRLQVLESDHLDTTRQGVIEGVPTLQGIGLGEAGEPVGYWLHRVHPGASWVLPGGAMWLSSQRVPARDVLHIYRKRRPGQIRDVSWLAPVLSRLRDLSDYEAALLMKAKIEACLAVVVSEDGDDAMTGPASALLRDAHGRTVESFEPGMILYRRGMGSVEVVNPSGGGSHAAFARRALEASAVGTGLTRPGRR